MKPVRNNILTKPFPPDEISEGGILVPESARKENNKMQKKMNNSKEADPKTIEKRIAAFLTSGLIKNDKKN